MNEASKTIHGITGIELTDMTAKVDPTTEKISEYHSSVRIAFGVEQSHQIVQKIDYCLLYLYLLEVKQFQKMYFIHSK